MKAGLPASAILHAALIGFGLVTLSAPPAHDAGEVQAIPVEIIGELTELRTGDKTASVKETPAPKPTERIDEVPDAKNVGDNDIDLDDVPKPEPKPRKVDTAAATPPPPAPEVKPEPKPEPVAETPPPPAPEPEPVAETPPPEPEPTDPVAEAIAQAEATKPAEEQMAFPDTLPKPVARPERPQQVARAEPPQEKPVEKKPEPRQQPDDLESLLDEAKALLDKRDPAGGGADRSRREASLGNDRPSTAAELSASEMDALRQRLAGCWSVPAGIEEPELLKVSVRFRLGRSGELEQQPEVIAGGASSGPGRIAAESAVRAVQKCAPFNLPADKYETWSEVVVNFDPSDMF